MNVLSLLSGGAFVISQLLLLRVGELLLMMTTARWGNYYYYTMVRKIGNSISWYLDWNWMMMMATINLKCIFGVPVSS